MAKDFGIGLPKGIDSVKLEGQTRIQYLNPSLKLIHRELAVKPTKVSH